MKFELGCMVVTPDGIGLVDNYNNGDKIYSVRLESGNINPYEESQLVFSLFSSTEKYEEWYKKWTDSFPEFTKSEEFNTPMDVESLKLAIAESGTKIGIAWKSVKENLQ